MRDLNAKTGGGGGVLSVFGQFNRGGRGGLCVQPTQPVGRPTFGQLKRWMGVVPTN